MTTLTPTRQSAIAATIEQMQLARGLGDAKNACSIAAINLALSGELTDEIPDCMSEVIGRWIIVIQDAMPATMRNSREWRELLPLAAGTGRAREPERLAIILDWMWDALTLAQPAADAGGFGSEWAAMCTERTADAAAYVDAAAYAAAYADAAHAAHAAHAAAAAAAAAVRVAADWQAINPPALLERLISL